MDPPDQYTMRSICYQLKYDLENVVGVNAVLCGPTYEEYDEYLDLDQISYREKIANFLHRGKYITVKLLITVVICDLNLTLSTTHSHF